MEVKIECIEYYCTRGGIEGSDLVQLYGVKYFPRHFEKLSSSLWPFTALFSYFVAYVWPLFGILAIDCGARCIRNGPK